MIDRTHPPKNSILTIRPYKLGSIWVFDYEAFGLIAEAFVGGINDMIDAMLQRADLPTSEPFTAMFSDKPFPGHHMQLQWYGEESGGNWYECVIGSPLKHYRGWLCPVLCLFFESAPDNIFVRAAE